jgi:hypothetical protein
MSIGIGPMTVCLHCFLSIKVDIDVCQVRYLATFELEVWAPLFSGGIAKIPEFADIFD